MALLPPYNCVTQLKLETLDKLNIAIFCCLSGISDTLTKSPHIEHSLSSLEF